MHLFTRYLLSLAALFAAVVGGYFFAAFVCYRFPWSENDPLYYLLKVVERLSPVLIVLLPSRASSGSRSARCASRSAIWTT